MAILHPLVPPPVDPQIHYDMVASVAPGASSTIDCLLIGAGKNGKLMGLIVTSSIPFRADVYTVQDGVQGYKQAMWFAHDGAWDFKPPSREFITVQGTTNIGQNGFRVTVTNLGIDAADICAVFYYDQE